MEEEEEMSEIYQMVKQKEFTILKTEMIMQQKSIYNETYKPLFINEMNDEKIKEFSKTLSQKLRHVKLAISKANLGQNKYANLGEEQVSKNGKGHVSNKTQVSRLLAKSSRKMLGEKESVNMSKSKSKSRHNSGERKGKKLKPFSKRKSVIAEYIRPGKRDMTTNEIFENCRFELEKQIGDLQKPFRTLAKKGKIKQIKEENNVDNNSVNFTEEEMKNIY